MSEQRLRLAKYLNQKQCYRATFGEIRHDDHNQPQVLLKDIYPVYPNGHKIPLRSNSSLTNKHGQQIAATHLWTSLDKSFLQVPFELLNGDQIQFEATVITYNIVRDNVIKKRNQIWENGKKAKDQVYKDYCAHVTNLHKAANATKDKAFAAHKHHLLTYDEMKDAQADADRALKKACQKAKRSCKRKMDRRLKKAQKAIEKELLVDYTLSQVNQIKVIHINHHFNMHDRFRYDPTRINDIEYTKFLAAHSMLASQDKLDTWSNQKEKSVQYAITTA